MALIHVAYASAARIDFSELDLRKLLESARRVNEGIDVTGMLLYLERSFFQIVEGEADVVTALYEKIGRDKRHHRIVKLIEEPIAERDFRDWSMGLARVTSSELARLPGFVDGRGILQSLDSLGEGMARRLLNEFRAGRWRANVGT
jgi:hypothetical protein